VLDRDGDGAQRVAASIAGAGARSLALA